MVTQALLGWRAITHQILNCCRNCIVTKLVVAYWLLCLTGDLVASDMQQHQSSDFLVTYMEHTCIKVTNSNPFTAEKNSLKNTLLVFIFFSFFFFFSHCFICLMLSHFLGYFFPPLPGFHISCQVTTQLPLKYHTTAVKKFWVSFCNLCTASD